MSAAEIFVHVLQVAVLAFGEEMCVPALTLGLALCFEGLSCVAGARRRELQLFGQKRVLQERREQRERGSAAMFWE